jgi:predicted lipid-binding transport protein (Tim44 family)
VVFDANSLVLMVVLALVFWTVGRKHEELRARALRQFRLAACLEAAPDSGTLALGANPEATARDAVEPPGESAGDVTGDLRRIAAMDGSFDPERFLESARHVYEAIVLAFAKGDRDLLADLLTTDVYRTFVHAIVLREARQQRVSLRFVRMKDARIRQAAIVDGQARIVVVFDSEIITATRDATNAVIAGDPAAMTAVADRWTFEKGLRSGGVWKLAATEMPRGIAADHRVTKSIETCG